MLEHLNSLACLVMLLCMFPVASLASPYRQPWHAALILLIGAGFSLQVMSPWVDWLPQPAWQTDLLHVAQAVAVLVWRRRIWLFIRSEFERPTAAHPHRRTSDLRPMRVEDMREVHGKGTVK